MERHEQHKACADPVYEQSLLSQAAVAKWKGSPVAWIEACPHQVHADLTTERNGLVMIDSGATQADFLLGARSVSREFTPGAIGYFAAGTELRLSRWRWANARRIYVDLDAGVAGCNDLLRTLEPRPQRTEIEFRDPELAAVLRTLVQEIAGGCQHGQLFAESLSLGIAMRIHGRQSSRHARGGERGKLAPADVQRVRDLVEAQLAQEISLSVLAAEAGFSPAQFVRLFRNTLGCTPHQYVLRTRLERARELVVGTRLPLALVASATGFASQSHMTSAFSSAFKAAPGQLRRQSRATLAGDPAEGDA